MPETGYLLAVLAVVFAITFALRAAPFAAIDRLRASRLVGSLARWLPAGVLLILAASTVRSSAAGGRVWQALAAVAVTVVVHLVGGRRTLLSVGAGTATFVLLVNLL
ncbi:AzlD domain-containing protein [Isoptericola cucumis]|uniref:Branched-chain amino acid transporter AzlD n=1 Tax=Isoptericola cucumis TaxID=1776856 RepID=A0ABQ2BBZ4_9MICO|nr:AzlD domain-containing protein [Isoptericola cucumis]GGI10779.1 branched-chain amino acid transporter AzlD [Isoptericola cucumis]